MARGCIMAVDPGLTGAIAFYFPVHNAISAYDMPVVDKDVDAASLADMIARLKPDFAIVEKVSSRPGEGVSSAFKFGSGFGIVRGVIAACGVPMALVTPQRWKKHFTLDADKEKSRALALRKWPARSELFGLKKHHGRAEAALLAAYAADLGL